MNSPAPYTYLGPDKDPRTIADPDSITTPECIALAQAGAVKWNEWRTAFPVRRESRGYENCANFAGADLRMARLEFAGFDFGPGANFRGTQFERGVAFSGAKLGELSSFHGAVFDSFAQFDEVEFGDYVSFAGATFGQGTNFAGSRFGACATFHAAIFGNETDFRAITTSVSFMCVDTKFGNGTVFDGSVFGTGSSFSGASFGDNTSFRGARFGNFASFCGRHSSSHTASHSTEKGNMLSVSFAGSLFAGAVDFGDRDFKGSLDFGRLKTALFVPDDTFDALLRRRRGSEVFAQKQPQWFAGTPVHFNEPPLFHNSSLPQDTTFSGAIWPRETGNETAARAYRTLKLAFADQQATREEQFFFRKELREESLQFSKWSPRRWLFGAYWHCSNYGFSVWRPLALWVATILAFAAMFTPTAGGHACWLWDTGCALKGGSLELSLLNALPLPGLEKLYDGAVQQSSALIAAEKALSILWLFLIGLALRNQFKMK